MSTSMHRFVDHVAHEFRTPLTVIKEYASLLREGSAGPMNSQQRELLEIIDTRAEDMAGTIDDMLDTSRLEAGVLSVWRRKTSFAEILEPIRTLLQRKADTRQVRFDVAVPDDLPLVFCDSEKIARVIVSLVDGMIGWCDSGSRSWLCVHPRPGDDELVVAVSVRGEQVDARPLVRALKHLDVTSSQGTSDPLSPQEEWFTMRLQVARELIRLNLGEIGVYSEQPREATLYFTLPRNEATGIVVRYLERLSGEGSSRWVSLVDATLAPTATPGTITQADKFLQRMFAAGDLVVPASPGRWLILAEASEAEMSEGLPHVETAWKTAEQVDGDPVAPPLTLTPSGTWQWPAQSVQLKAVVRSLISPTQPPGPHRFSDRPVGTTLRTRLRTGARH